MAASSPLLRWGLILSAVVVAFAVAFRLQQNEHEGEQQQQQQHPLYDSTLDPDHPSSSSHTTYCYDGIRTLDEETPSAQCFSVVDGKFSQILTEQEATALLSEEETDNASEAVSVVRNSGHVIPGLWDGHGHLLQYGEFLHSVDLFGTSTLQEVRDRIKDYLKSNPEAGSKDVWLRGVGWDQTAFGRMPTADDIEQDSDLRGIYMMLDRIDVHCSWVSQSVLDLLPADLPAEVPGGEIVRDPGMGVFCDNAMDIVMSRWPKPTDAIKAQQVRTAMEELNKVGIVGMHDAGITPGNIALYNDLSANHKDDWWSVRVYGMLECDKRNTFCPEDAASVVRSSHEGTEEDDEEDTRFTVRSVKLFADGALGSWGSAMIDPYTDHPWTSGSLLVNATQLTLLATSWASQGFQVNIHAIGDLANRYAIDALEAALRQQCLSDTDHISGQHDSDNDDKAATVLRDCQANHHRFRIEHAQIIHPDDQARILRLGILPSIQPTHATSDARYAQDRLGRDRLLSSAYRMRSLLPASPVLGSDFPVEPPNPFQGLYAAVARKSPLAAGDEDGETGSLMEEALTLDQALHGFTRGAAYGAFLESKAGVIRPGAFADWVVLDEPLGQGDLESLRTLAVRETWVGGKQVYER